MAKWSQPKTPPPPMFVGKKERDLVKQVNDELLERVVGQQVIYYPISHEHSKFHSLYGESIEKTFLPPIHIYALVDYQGSETTTDNFGIDKLSTIEVHFHKKRLVEDQNLFVREGDFIQYDNKFYEIVLLSEPRYLFGQDNQKLEIMARCKKTREGIMNPNILYDSGPTAIQPVDEILPDSSAPTTVSSSVPLTNNVTLINVVGGVPLDGDPKGSGFAVSSATVGDPTNNTPITVYDANNSHVRVVDSFKRNAFMTAKYIVSIEFSGQNMSGTDNINHLQTIEVVVSHNNSVVNYTAYGLLSTAESLPEWPNDDLILFDFTMTGDDIEFKVQSVFRQVSVRVFRTGLLPGA